MKASLNQRLTRQTTSIICLFCFILLVCCNTSQKKSSIEMITDGGQQTAVFKDLVQLTNLTANMQADSMAFLILPVQASCPACRNKTIDSVVQHKDDLPDNHFIVISANGGKKTINGYFLENNKSLPVIENRLFLDSTNQAYLLKLYDKKPTIYYVSKGKAYKKVAAIPTTVKDDLREFFSGHRNEKQLASSH